MGPKGQPVNAQQWLLVICEEGDHPDSKRITLIEEFYYWARPVIRRAAGTLAVGMQSTHERDRRDPYRHPPPPQRRGNDDLELLVTETFFALVSDVVGGRQDPAHGHALYSFLLYQTRARFQDLARARARVSNVAPVTQALRDIASDLSLDRPHMAKVLHVVSGDTSYVGWFPGAVEALRAADDIETHLQRRDLDWRVTAHPLIDPVQVMTGLDEAWRADPYGTTQGEPNGKPVETQCDGQEGAEACDRGGEEGTR